jgi:enamine deaminase RidA (YjgF/YER057c/UK114 family)
VGVEPDGLDAQGELPEMSRRFLALALITGCATSHPSPETAVTGNVSYLSPEGMHSNPAYSQLVVASGRVRTVYVGGQNAVDASGGIVGKGDIGAQAAQVARNLQTALAAAQARPEHVVKWTVYIVQGQPIGPALGAFQQVLGKLPHAPAVTAVFVAALGNPDFLLEVEAIAVVPEQ